jgi:hypothetical protein
MSITKSDCRSFVSKVRGKAIETIKERYDKQIEVAVEKYLKEFHPEVFTILHELVDIKSRYLEVKKSLRDVIGVNLYTDLPDITVWDLTATGKCGEEVQKLVDERKKALNEVGDEYYKVYSLIDGCRDGKKALKVLKELSFDTSSLENVSLDNGIEKEKLFPCRKNEGGK